MSTDERLEAQLQRLMAPRVEPPATPASVPSTLMTSFRTTTAKRAEGGSWLRRIGLGVGVGAGLLVGACALPADVDMDLGVALAMAFEGERDLPVDAIAEFCRRELGAEHITVELALEERSDGGPGTGPVHGDLHMELWGPRLDPDAVVPALQAQFTLLADRPISSERLEGAVRTNLGGKLMHRYFDVDRFLDAEDVDAARMQVLAELRAQGIEGEIDVEIEQLGDHRAVRIGVHERVEDTDG